MKEFFASAWGKMPWWMKFYTGIVIVPNQAVTTALFLYLVVPWVNSSITATTSTSEERLNTKIQNAIELQKVYNKSILEEMKRLNQHQSIQYQAILDLKNK